MSERIWIDKAKVFFKPNYTRESTPTTLCKEMNLENYLYGNESILSNSQLGTENNS
jgi:hypothetical protein